MKQKQFKNLILLTPAAAADVVGDLAWLYGVLNDAVSKRGETYK